jgi:hypothetical protein
MIQHISHLSFIVLSKYEPNPFINKKYYNGMKSGFKNSKVITTRGRLSFFFKDALLGEGHSNTKDIF